MGRNYGVPVRDYYTAEEFKDGCTFNLWMGTGIGVVFSAITGLGFLWYHGLIL